MRFGRFQSGDETVWGRLDGEVIVRLSHAPWDDLCAPTGEEINPATVRVLAPAEPGKIVAVGRNYAEHAAELGLASAERPRIFFKPPTAVIGPGESIVLPRQSAEVHHEAELAVVIGRRCRDVAPHDAEAVIAGYTCANDVTARDIQRADGQPSYAKAFDTFCPLGPWLTQDLPTECRIRCRVNDVQRQDGAIANMLTSVPELLGYISAAMTLLPGDVVLTGTPAGVGVLEPGDTVTVEIDGIGALTNPVEPAR
ncbi:Fumarylacetoacetate hydrolase domain-containing protein 2 like protein [Nocardia seriolae]|uniref:Fumarylacetoacetate hydrolase domain-containing protein 2 like protein n=1 Tax=Nocardia seriolae TaxID=37332 RepID=A0ABC8ARG5_9NOCA|nr:fumarylacetoacetate hydrolase family protein [Nocardia seriolae]APA96715.1 Fumarylacetoacetate hydrolase domain-containing protein 2 like protein [Nocardia seriolae]